MAPSSRHIPVTLRPAPTDDHESDSIASLLSRLVQERGSGSLKTLTEESLLEAIVAEQAARDAAGDSEEDASEPEPEQTSFEERRAYLYAKANELKWQMQAARRCTNPVANGLSLLLTKYLPYSTVEPSMEHPPPVPAGMMGEMPPLRMAYDTLAFDIANASKQNLERHAAEDAEEKKAKQRRDEEIAMGWKLDVLERTAQKVTAAAKRLEGEMEKEQRYWTSLTELQDQKWSITRTRERGTLGVRYGFGEGRSAVGALRVGHEGRVRLDLGRRPKPRRLRVRIMRGGEVESSSVIPFAQPEDAPLQDLVKQARDTLFDEELLQELIREAPSLLGAGVRQVVDTVSAPLDTEALSAREANRGRRMWVDLVALPTAPISSGEAQSTANLLAISLRLLLSALHRSRLEKRSQPPPPMPKVLSKDKGKPKLPPVHDILRTVLNLYAQNAAGSGLLSQLRPLVQTLESAQYDAALVVDRLDLASDSASALVASLARATLGRVRIHLPNQHITVRIVAEPPPLIGTTFLVTHSEPPRADVDATMTGTDAGPPAPTGPSSPEMPFDTLSSVMAHLTASIQTSILSHLVRLRTVKGWALDPVQPHCIGTRFLLPAADLRSALLQDRHTLPPGDAHSRQADVALEQAARAQGVVRGSKNVSVTVQGGAEARLWMHWGRGDECYRVAGRWGEVERGEERTRAGIEEVFQSLDSEW